MRRGLAALLVALVLAGGGLTSAADAGASSLSRHHPRPAGRSPSPSARMICAREARADVAAGIGVKATQVTTPTWVDHVYSCQYQYSDGLIAVSVKELQSKKATTRYFASLAKLLGRQRESISLGQGAFLTANGSVVVRKDYKVLDVDISRLPARFGNPPQSPSDVALGVAATIMGCWTGS